MARSLHKRLAALAAAGCLLAVAAPALAVTPACTTTTVTQCIAGVPVTLTSTGGTRQFAVENIGGTELAALDLGTGGSQPFRTHVTDTNFSSLTEDYTVGATMSNLYLKSGATHNYTVKVPSSEVALAYGTTPLSALGLSLATLPKLSLSGVLSSCGSLPAAAKTTLGLSAIGAVVDPTDLALVQLCAALGTGVPVSGTVDGLLQTVTPAVTSLLDLPTALTGAESGAFTNPAFAGTVGSADPAAGTAPAATPRRIMTGTHGMSAGLQAALTTALNNALAGVPLTSVNDLGARTTLAAVVASLQGSSTAAVAAAGNAIALLGNAAKEVAVLNSMTSTLVPPVLGDILRVSGQYFGFPILQATPTAPVPGVYDGTLTVTFVQG